MVRILIILSFVSLFASCTNNKTIEIADIDLEQDRFYSSNSYNPFSGKCIVSYVGSDNTKLESTYSDGILEGKTIMYHEDGTLYRKGNYVSGNHEGLWEGWFKNGKKEFEINYQNGKLNGNYIAYYQNGSIKEKGEYQNDSRINEWISYDSQGNEISKKSYN